MSFKPLVNGAFHFEKQILMHNSWVTDKRKLRLGGGRISPGFFFLWKTTLNGPCKIKNYAREIRHCLNKKKINSIVPRNSEQSLSRHSKNLPEDQILISGNVTNEMNYCYGCQIYLLKKDKHLLSFLIQTNGEHVITAMGNAL